MTEAAGSIVVSTHGLLREFNQAGVLDPLDVHAASTIGRLLGEDEEQVLLAAALTVRGTRFGHVCIDLATQREAVVVDGTDPEVIDTLPWPDPDAWQQAVATSRLVGDRSGDHPLILADGRLYLERYFRYESTVADLLSDRAAAPSQPVPDVVRDQVAALLGADGEDTTQQQAALRALSGKLVVIAGGPGTGKTYTIAALLAALASEPDRFPLVAVAAPTGKAAARLTDAITERAAGLDDPQAAELLGGVEASTIHRLLGWTWARGRFLHHAGNRLPHELVVVDETSMVSLPLASKLLGAVRDDATVVLVGDPHQLESIEAGTVLSDIVAAAADHPGSAIADRVVVLDRPFRFAESSIRSQLAEAVRVGDADRTVSLLRAGSDELGWIERRTDTSFAELWQRVASHRIRLVETAAAGDPDTALFELTRLAVLCARRQGPDSVARWSRDTEAALDDRFPGLRWNGDWYPGRPVMITTNDYTLELYNGDIGVAIDTDEGLRVAFERGAVHRPSHLGEHTTVHAMTIHKAQGSQFDEVVVVLPPTESRLLTRELLYTAVTRAKQRVWLVGEEAVVRAAVTRRVQRASRLGARTANPGL